MAGQNDFLVFDENQDNMLTQDLYQSDADRTDGFKKGLARSIVNNKVLHQTSMMSTALGEIVKDRGYVASDSNLTDLKSNLANAINPIILRYSDTTIFQQGDWAVTSENKIFVSLKRDNVNHPLTDGDYWKKLQLGGGGGKELLEIYLDPFIDESENKGRILNGQIIIQEQFPTAVAKFKTRIGWDGTTATLMPNIVCTEDEWQSAKTLSPLGQVSKFVIDDTAGTVRLPAIKNIQGAYDLQSVGGLVNAGLPNITGTFNSDYADRITGAFYTISKVKGNVGAGDDWLTGFDASRSNPIYGRSETVQQEACQFPYCICLNTGVEEAERPINDYTVAVPYSYGMCIYSEHILQNACWLRSNSQENDGAIYKGLYEWAVTKLNEGADGFKATGDSTATDYDWKIDTSRSKFILPLKSRLASGKAVVGNGIAVGFTDGSSNGGMIMSSSNLGAKIDKYGVAVGETWSSTTNLGNKTIGLVTDPEKSGIELSDSDLYLYYYVGVVNQNEGLVNVARIEEKLVDINSTSRGYLVEKYEKDGSGYRLYSDKYCEQWGITNVFTSNPVNVVLLKEYPTTDYNIQFTPQGTNVRGYATTVSVKNNNSFSAICGYCTNTGVSTSANGNCQINWKTCGYVE